MACTSLDIPKQVSLKKPVIAVDPCAGTLARTPENTPGKRVVMDGLEFS
jgi:hypothetical protein